MVSTTKFAEVAPGGDELLRLQHSPFVEGQRAEFIPNRR
jgi:hypothetical protein